SNFLEFCFPSLEAEGGLRLLLSEREVTLLVVACRPHAAEIERYLKDRKLDCTLVCQPIPDRLCEPPLVELVKASRDWLIGALQYLHMVAARNLDADFHAINPNAVYGGGDFSQGMRIAAARPALLSGGTRINNRHPPDP